MAERSVDQKDTRRKDISNMGLKSNSILPPALPPRNDDQKCNQTNMNNQNDNDLKNLVAAVVHHPQVSSDSSGEDRSSTTDSDQRKTPMTSFNDVPDDPTNLPSRPLVNKENKNIEMNRVAGNSNEGGSECYNSTDGGGYESYEEESTLPESTPCP